MEPYYEEGKIKPRRREGGTGRIWIVATLVLFVLVVALSGVSIFLFNEVNHLNTTAAAQKATPTPVAPAPTPTQPLPTPTPAASAVSLNVQLPCQQCQEPGVVASIKSYTVNANGTTSVTVVFTDHTGKAVDMKVDTIKLLDQSGNPVSIQSSDPYVGVPAGQTSPTTIIFQFTPSAGMKYTLSMVMEEADVFANFYQSAAFSFS